MKRRILSFILAMLMVIPCAINLTACKKEEDGGNGNVVYTVSEQEWEINFNITKSNPTATPLSAQVYSNEPTQLAPITSYTLRGEGFSGNQQGWGVIKYAPNGMDIEFWLDGKLEDETQIIPSTDEFYVGMKFMLASYFPFSGKYSQFTYNSAKNVYVIERLKSTVVNESNIEEFYDVFNKKVEIKFVNGYLSTVYVELCQDEEYGDVVSALTFTFSKINNTTVTLPV